MPNAERRESSVYYESRNGHWRCQYGREITKEKMELVFNPPRPANLFPWPQKSL